MIPYNLVCFCGWNSADSLAAYRSTAITASLFKTNRKKVQQICEKPDLVNVRAPPSDCWVHCKSDKNEEEFTDDCFGHKYLLIGNQICKGVAVRVTKVWIPHLHLSTFYREVVALARSQRRPWAVHSKTLRLRNCKQLPLFKMPPHPHTNTYTHTHTYTCTDSYTHFYTHNHKIT